MPKTTTRPDQARLPEINFEPTGFPYYDPFTNGPSSIPESNIGFDQTIRTFSIGPSYWVVEITGTATADEFVVVAGAVSGSGLIAVASPPMPPNQIIFAYAYSDTGAVLVPQVGDTLTGATTSATVVSATGSFSFYYRGRKFTKTGVETILCPDPEFGGPSFVWYDGDGVLTQANAEEGMVGVLSGTMVAAVIWDAVGNKLVSLLDKRYGTILPNVEETRVGILGEAMVVGDSGPSLNLEGPYALDGDNRYCVRLEGPTGAVIDCDILKLLQDGWPQQLAENDEWMLVLDGTGSYNATYPGETVDIVRASVVVATATMIFQNGIGSIGGTGDIIGIKAVTNDETPTVGDHIVGQTSAVDRVIVTSQVTQQPNILIAPIIYKNPSTENPYKIEPTASSRYNPGGSAPPTNYDYRDIPFLVDTGTGNACYNNAGTLVPAPDNSFIAFAMFVSTDPVHPVVIVPGDRFDWTLAQAMANNDPGVFEGGGGLGQKLVGRAIMEINPIFTNPGHACIIDWQERKEQKEAPFDPQDIIRQLVGFSPVNNVSPLHNWYDNVTTMDARVGNCNLTLSSDAEKTRGRKYLFVRIDNSANACAIFAPPGDTINNMASISLPSLYSAVELVRVYDGIAGGMWHITQMFNMGLVFPTVDAIKTITGAYTATTSDRVLLASGTTTVNLPQVSTCKGLVLSIKKTDLTANGVLVVPYAGDTLEGGPGVLLSTLPECATIISDGGTNWQLTSSVGLLVGPMFFTETISSSDSLNMFQTTIQAEASGGAVVLDLPQANKAKDKIYCITKIDSSAYTVTVAGYSSETIDGATTKVLGSQWASVIIVCDGSGWFTLGATYAAGTGVSISNGKISGAYTAGAGIDITTGVISATAVSPDTPSVSTTDGTSTLLWTSDVVADGDHVKITAEIIATETDASIGSGGRKIGEWVAVGSFLRDGTDIVQSGVTRFLDECLDNPTLWSVAFEIDNTAKTVKINVVGEATVEFKGRITTFVCP